MAASRSTAPWSVKGIDRDARETAKEAAQREGMTVGAWLNQIIYSAANPKSTDGAVDGLKLQDLVTAIEGLNKRIAAEERKSSDAIADLSRTFGGVVERLQSVEQGGGDPEVAVRLTRLEEKSTDRQRINTLKALEKAVGQVALQFESTREEALSRIDNHEQQLKSLAERVMARSEDQSAEALNQIKSAMDALTGRIDRAERIAAEASKIKQDADDAHDPEFVARTGERLRVLGDEIKRGGDQIRSLETAINKLTGQIDAAERRSAEGVEKVSETIAALREQFSDVDSTDPRQDLEAAVAAATQHTEDRLTALQHSFDDMIARIDGDTSQASAPSQSTVAQEAPRDQAPDVQTQAPQAETAEPSFDEFTADLDDDDASETSAPVAEQPTPGSSQNDILEQVREAFGDEFNDENEPQSNKDDNDLDAVLAELESMGFAEDEKQGASLRRPAPPQVTAAVADAPATANDAETPEPATDAPTDTDQSAPSKPLTKRQLTAKQRAILAARIRRKRMEATNGSDAEREADTNANQSPSAAAPALAATAAALHDVDDQIASDAVPGADDETSSRDEIGDEETSSVVDRINNALSGIKSRLKAADEEEAGLDSAAEDNASIDDDQMLENEAEAEASGSTDDPISDALSAAEAEEEAIAKAAAALDQASDTDETEQQDETEASADEKALYDLADDDEDLDADDFSVDADAAADEPTGKQGRSPARFVAGALGVSIVLAVSALGFIAYDTYLTPQQQSLTIGRPTAPQDAAPAQTNANPATAGQTLAEVPPAPAVKPRDLYLDGVVALQNAGDPAAETAAIQKLQEAAALGHPPAQLQLGELYKTGQGVETDLIQARTWYERAANGGNILAMHRIGVMSAQGQGGARNLEAAIVWFEQAGNRALIDAQYNLGAIYHPTADGAGGVQDAAKAYYWYSLAAKNGDAQAASFAAGVGDTLSAAERNTIDANVAAWEPTPANPSANEIAPAS